MAIRCDRCGRAFRNKYAVWGHLRACRPSSVEAEPAQPGSSAYGLAQPGLEPQFGEELVQIVKQAREQVYAPLLKAQDDASAAAARAVAEREARLAQERVEAQRRRCPGSKPCQPGPLSQQEARSRQSG
jgi:hypothetical protein